MGRWHNRLLFDRAEGIGRSAVAVLNRQKLDMVVFLGDISHDGAESQVRSARALLAGLTVPWLALPGNHDGEAIRSGQFDQVFRGNVPGFYRRQGDVGMLFLRESLLDYRDDSPNIRLGRTCIERAVQAVGADGPGRLIVFSHFPLVSQVAYARQHGSRDVGHYADGMDLLARLEGLVPNRVVVFCGHQHWHRVMESEGWIHCTTGAMIEYPMEVRIASLEASVMRSSIVAGVADEIAAESLEAATWVRGQGRDRDCEFALPRT